MASKPQPDTAGEAGSGQPLAYDHAKRLASDGDVAARRELAGRTDVAPELLYYLAEDADAGVRRAIAANSATPRQADLRLAADPSESVRIDLAHKIARLTPELSAGERDRLGILTTKALGELANDALPEIRRIIAESIKDIDFAPADVVRRLARDVELMVAAPVLEFSPLLSDDDLLEIINSDPVRGGLSAISRRANVAGSVSDAVAATGDAEAITHLLANPSAQIREETLDALIDQAPGHEPWHLPLATRPNLSAEAAGNIARLVSAAVLREMERANRLSPDVAKALAGGVESRLEASAPAGSGTGAALQAHEQGSLDETLVLHHIAEHHVIFVKHALALLTEIPPLIVGRILRSRDPGAIIALTHKAGLGMAVAVQLQSKFARLGKKAIIADDFPWADEEMEQRLSDYLR